MKLIYIILTWLAGLFLILLSIASVIYTIYIQSFWWCILALIGFVICVRISVILIVIADDWYNKYLNWKEYIKNNNL
jgi:hypothetical protein